MALIRTPAGFGGTGREKWDYETDCHFHSMASCIFGSDGL